MRDGSAFGMSNDNDVPAADPTMKPNAPKQDGESMPPAGGESMAPTDSKHPFAGPGQGSEGEAETEPVTTPSPPRRG